MHLRLIVVLIACALCLPSSARATNESTALIVHVDQTIFGGCDLAEGANDPCDSDGANTELGAPGGIPTVYLVARGYDSLRGVQTAFDWTGHSLLGQGWDCRANQLSATTPNPASSGGPLDGTIATAFDAIFGGESAAIGRMNVAVGGGDCFIQVESAFENGTHVLSDILEVTPVHPEARGSACVSGPGVDACGGPPIPVEPVTWGAIKHVYAR